MTGQSSTPRSSTTRISSSNELRLPEFFIDAHCLVADPEAFFPDKGENNDPAKRICRGCDIRDECLEWALTNPDLAAYGVWGGMSERQRRRLRMRR